MGLGNPFLQFIYPTFCLHCEGDVEKPHQLLCRECGELIEWVRQRCVYCGTPLEEGRVCIKCSHTPFLLPSHHSLFIPFGPIRELYTFFLHSKRPETLASLIVIGMDRLHLSTPDYIVPYLLPRSKSFFLKRQSSSLLAQKVSKLLGCSFTLHFKDVEGKTVLLISDWLFNGKELRVQRQNLQQFFPKKINSLACIDGR